MVPSAPTVTWHFADDRPAGDVSRRAGGHSASNERNEDQQRAQKASVSIHGDVRRRLRAAVMHNVLHHLDTRRDELSLCMPYRAWASSISQLPADLLLSLKFHWLGPDCGERFPTFGMKFVCRRSRLRRGHHRRRWCRRKTKCPVPPTGGTLSRAIADSLTATAAARRQHPEQRRPCDTFQEDPEWPRSLDPQPLDATSPRSSPLPGTAAPSSLSGRSRFRGGHDVPGEALFAGVHRKRWTRHRRGTRHRRTDLRRISRRRW